MSKVCIVTVYNSINSGSYLQAWALSTVLREKGAEVVFLKRKNTLDSSSSSVRQFLMIMKALIIKRDKNRARLLMDIFRGFKKAQQEFVVVSNCDKSINSVILGSDTIWNLEDKFFYKMKSEYWGLVFDEKIKVSAYAVSIANTELGFLKKQVDCVASLKRMEYVCVRDRYTAKVLKEVSGRKYSIVCDPTFLIDKSGYLELINKYNPNPPQTKYIYLYLFENLPKDIMIEIRKYATENNLKIIGGIENIDGVDEYIVNTPINFLMYMYYAEFVITDTFHGCAFSINFLKKFLVMKRNKQKVDELLNVFELSNLYIGGGDNDISTRIKEYAICNEYINHRLMELRRYSMSYLDKMI